MATARSSMQAFVCVIFGATSACSAAHPAPAPSAAASSTTRASMSSVLLASAPDASVEDASLPTVDASIDVAPAAAISPLATLFDGDPSSGAVRLVETRCGPGCLEYPSGWLSTDDHGFVYAWFFRGEGKFTTAEVMRSPLAKLDDDGIALRLRFAGGEKVTWSAPIEGTIGKDHAHALLAEGVGTSRGRKARFWYAYVDGAKRKDLVIAYVVDGEPTQRIDETMAVMKSAGMPDGKVRPVPHD